MRSQFNIEFNKFLAEEGINGMTLSDVAGAAFPNASSNTTNTSSISANTQQFKKHGDGIIGSMLKIAPGVLKTLETQSKLWSGKTDIGLSDLAELIKGYNEKKALNAMHGIINYSKSKNPVLMMQNNDMMKTIRQQLLQTQNNEK